MRILMWFAIGFTAGCIPGSYLLWNDWYILAGFLLLAVGIGLCTLKNKNIRKCSLILLGLSVALLWMWGFQEIRLKPARQYDGKTVSATIVISDYGRQTDFGVSADGKMELDGQSYRVCAYMDDLGELKPGDRVRGRFQLRLTAMGGKEEATWHQGRGIYLLAYAEDKTLVTYGDSVPLRYFPAKLRHNIVEQLNQTFSSDTKGFAKALLLGDSSDLTYQEDTAFKVSGIRHVIAVSGLHISILCALVYVLSGRNRVLTPVIGIPVLILFAAVAGFTPSVSRACIMQCLVMLALLLNKKYDPPTAIAFAVLVLLAVNPMAITSVSLQLSVGCTIGILLLSGRISRYILRLLHAPKDKSLRARVSRWIAGTMGVTLSATVVTIPLSAFYFGTVSLIGIVTNVLVLWVVSFVFYGIMLTCLLGALWLPLGKAVGWLIGWLIRYILWMADVLSSVPYASVYTCSVYIVIWLIVSYGLFALLLFAKRKRPMLTMGCSAVILAVALFAAWLEPRTDDFRMTVMDVGQGQAILFRDEGKTYLVDCGGSSAETAADVVAQHLLSQSVFRIDGLILTHYDVDHSGGVPFLLSRINVDKLYLPDMADDGSVKELLRQMYSDRILWIEKTSKIQYEAAEITMIPGENGKDENENSMCILFQAEDCDILITGDRNQMGERELIQNYPLPKVELLIAGHHGANTATGFELLSATQPKVVAISVDKDNRYGHPSRELLERLNMLGCHVYRTDRDGMIIFRR